MKVIKVLVLIFSLSLFCSCSLFASYKITDKLSDSRLGIYCAHTEFCYVEFTYGYREEPFIYNGISENKVPFGIIMLWFNEQINSNFVQIELIYENLSELIVLEKSPYDESFGADIGKIIEPKVISVKILNGEHCQKQIMLSSKSKDWHVSNSDAMQISEDYFQNDFNQLSQSGENYECYLKILSNQAYEQFFWFFSYYSTSGKRAQIAIDVNTGKIISHLKELSDSV